MNVNRLTDPDTLETEVEQNVTVFNDIKSLLITFAKDLNSIDAQLRSNEASNYSKGTVDVMKQLISDKKSVERCYLSAKQTLEMNIRSEEDGNLVDLNSCFDDILQGLNSQINYDNDSNFCQLLKILSTENEVEDLELETMETAPFRIPTDPFMKTQIDNPVKNKLCGHIYDKKCFKQYLEMCANNPRKLICPFGGCQNKERLMLNSVEDDIELRIKIRQAKASN